MSAGNSSKRQACIFRTRAKTHRVAVFSLADICPQNPQACCGLYNSVRNEVGSRSQARWSSLEESRMTYCRSTLLAALSFSAVLSAALAQVLHAPPSNTQLASPQIERKVDA